MHRFDNSLALEKINKPLSFRFMLACQMLLLTLTSLWSTESIVKLLNQIGLNYMRLMILFRKKSDKMSSLKYTLPNLTLIVLSSFLLNTCKHNLPKEVSLSVCEYNNRSSCSMDQ